MTPTELLVELHRCGITVHTTGDGHLRLTGATEAALTPALRDEVATQRPALAALLAPPVSGPAEDGTAVRPVSLDTAAPAPPADSSSGLPGWLVWGGLVVVAAILGVAYLLARPAGAAVPEAPSPAPPPAAWPYSGQSWYW